MSRKDTIHVQKLRLMTVVRSEINLMQSQKMNYLLFLVLPFACALCLSD
jgi:hypothetical protein